MSTEDLEKQNERLRYLEERIDKLQCYIWALEQYLGVVYTQRYEKPSNLPGIPQEERSR